MFECVSRELIAIMVWFVRAKVWKATSFWFAFGPAARLLNYTCNSKGISSASTASRPEATSDTQCRLILFPVSRNQTPPHLLFAVFFPPRRLGIRARQSSTRAKAATLKFISFAVIRYVNRPLFHIRLRSKPSDSSSVVSCRLQVPMSVCLWQKSQELR
jgi:hypothetical protein